MWLVWMVLSYPNAYVQATAFAIWTFLPSPIRHYNDKMEPYETKPGDEETRRSVKK